MERRLKFPEPALLAGGNYNPDLPSAVANGMAVKFDGEVTAGAGGGITGVTLDTPANLLGSLEFLKGNNTKIRMRMVDLWHLDALINGRYGEKLAPTPAATVSAPMSINAEIPFHLGGILDEKITLVESRDEKLVFKGRFGALTDYASTNMGSFTGTLRPSIKTPSDLQGVGGYLEPDFVQRDIKMDIVSDNIVDYITLAEPQLLVGLMIRQYDNTGAGDAQRTDGILRQLLVEVEGKSEAKEIYRARTGEMKQDTAKFFGIPLAEMKAGVYFVPFKDDSNDFGFRLFGAGDRVKLTLNTSFAVEQDIAAVVAAASDLLIVTPIFYKFKTL